MKRTQGERIIYPVGEEFDVEKVVKDTRSENIQNQKLEEK